MPPRDWAVRSHPLVRVAPVHAGRTIKAVAVDTIVNDVMDFFTGCECTNVRIIEDKELMKPKGFGYAEFASRDGLKQALTLNGSQFQGRNIRISVAAAGTLWILY